MRFVLYCGFFAENIFFGRKIYNREEVGLLVPSGQLACGNSAGDMPLLTSWAFFRYFRRFSKFQPVIVVQFCLKTEGIQRRETSKIKFQVGKHYDKMFQCKSAKSIRWKHGGEWVSRVNLSCSSSKSVDSSESFFDQSSLSLGFICLSRHIDFVADGPVIEKYLLG